MLKFLTILKVGTEGDRAQQDALDPDGARHHHRRRLRHRDDRRRAGLAGGDPGADLVARDELPHDLSRRRDAVGGADLHGPVDADRGRRGGRAGRVSRGRLRVADRRARPPRSSSGSLNWGTQVQGVGVEWPFIRSWNVEQGRLLQRVRRARRGEGLRPRHDGRQRPLRGPGPGRPDRPDQELPVPRGRRARDQGRQHRWGRTRTTSSSPRTRP